MSNGIELSNTTTSHSEDLQNSASTNKKWNPTIPSKEPSKAMSILCYLTNLLVAPSLTAVPRLVINEAILLDATSTFLLHRHLGYESISDLLDTEAVGYECCGINKLTVRSFISQYQFPFPVESIQASMVREKCTVEIKYQPGLLLSREMLLFEPSSLKIKAIHTTYRDDQFEIRSFLPRIHICGGADDENSLNALTSARLLNLASKFLKADVSQDLDMQYNLLSDDAVAFGVKGKNGIIAAQKEGIEAGTTYSLPFPLQINIDVNCISLDFLSHKNGLTERGTDIMYLDLVQDKVIRIDTLRHTLSQPNWVKNHYAMKN